MDCTKRASTLLVLGAVAFASGCATTGNATTNADMAESYYSGAYDDMVAAEPTRDGPAGSEVAISPHALETLQMEIADGAAPSVERCMESEMERLDTRWLAGSFSFEMHVEPNGQVTKAKLIEHDVRESRVADGAQARHAEGFGPCVETKLLALELDPIVERTYVHTYVGYVGEAW